MDDLVPEAGNLENFIKQFEVFAGAPGGVGELRGVILKLAVMGRLVQELPGDEPVGKVLEKINLEKLRLLNKGEIKKTKDLGPVLESDRPYSIPKHWIWHKLGNYAYVFSGNAFKSNEFNSLNGIKVIKITNAGVGELIETKEYLPIEFIKKYEGFKVLKNDLILALTRPYISAGLKISMCPETYHNSLLNQRVAAIRTYTDSFFLYAYLKSPFVLNVFKKRFSGSGLQPNLKMLDVTNLAIPVPPLEEQKRIVAKVDELMALCDTLEAQQQQQAQTVLRTNTAAINALLNPAPQSEQNSPKTTEKETSTTLENSFEQNWQRIAQHFNTLYGCTLPMPKGQGRKKKHLVGLENVKGLKNVILGLAVEGKLVKNNLSERKPEVLRDSAGKVPKVQHYKKGKKLKPVGISEMPFNLPNSWYWVRLGETGYNWGQAKPEHEFTYIDVSAIDNAYGEIIAPNVIQPQDAPSRARKLVRKDTVIYSTVRPYLKNIAVIDKDFSPMPIASTAFAIIHPFDVVLPRFIYFYLRSPLFVKYVESVQKGVAYPAINDDKFFTGLFPLPPLEEQKRIVTKVDQLMSLCDQLEQHLTQSYSDAEKLMQATVKVLVA